VNVRDEKKIKSETCLMEMCCTIHVQPCHMKKLTSVERQSLIQTSLL